MNLFVYKFHISQIFLLKCKFHLPFILCMILCFLSLFNQVFTPVPDSSGTPEFTPPPPPVTSMPSRPDTWDGQGQGKIIYAVD